MSLGEGVLKIARHHYTDSFTARPRLPECHGAPPKGTYEQDEPAKFQPAATDGMV
jgi:hypothetical protein